jgi:putative transposase
VRRKDSFRLPDPMWERLEALLPKQRRRNQRKGGRPPLNRRRVADAIFYLLRTGIQWKALPRELGSGSSAHRYFQQWQQAGVFEELWAVGLLEYDDCQHIQWKWQSMDGAMVKAPLGGGKTGPNPTDRAKGGTKRSLLVDGAGVPIGLTIDGANVHDKRLVEATLASIPIDRPHPTSTDPQHLCLDKGYDYTDIREFVALQHYIAHIKTRGEEVMLKRTKGYKARRWVVERTHSWFNRFRRKGLSTSLSLPQDVGPERIQAFGCTRVRNLPL